MRESPKRTISASGGLEPLQMVSESRHQTMCQWEGCSLKGVDTRRCASKDVGSKGGGFGGVPTSIDERNEWQWRRWDTAPKGVDLAGGLSLIGERNECQWGWWDATPKGGVDFGRVPHRLEKGTSASEDAGTRFKALSGRPKGKAQRGQYLLVVDLGRYRLTKK